MKSGAVGALERHQEPVEGRAARHGPDQPRLPRRRGRAASSRSAHGFPEQNLLTERSRKIWLYWKEKLSEHRRLDRARRRGGEGPRHPLVHREVRRRGLPAAGHDQLQRRDGERRPRRHDDDVRPVLQAAGAPRRLAGHRRGTLRRRRSRRLRLDGLGRRQHPLLRLAHRRRAHAAGQVARAGGARRLSSGSSTAREVHARQGRTAGLQHQLLRRRTRRASTRAPRSGTAPTARRRSSIRRDSPSRTPGRGCGPRTRRRNRRYPSASRRAESRRRACIRTDSHAFPAPHPRRLVPPTDHAAAPQLPALRLQRPRRSSRRRSARATSSSSTATSASPRPSST